MVTVCAWCQKYMGMKEPLADPAVTHGICHTCALRQQIGEMPTLVIARERADTLAVFQGLLSGTPEIRVVVDRRERERRSMELAAQAERERRNQQDRRQATGVYLI
jgi:hypothetical protein